jgi:hypothetical protein
MRVYACNYNNGLFTSGMYYTNDYIGYDVIIKQDCTQMIFNQVVDETDINHFRCFIYGDSIYIKEYQEKNVFKY